MRWLDDLLGNWRRWRRWRGGVWYASYFDFPVCAVWWSRTSHRGHALVRGDEVREDYSEETRRGRNTGRA